MYTGHDHRRGAWSVLIHTSSPAYGLSHQGIPRRYMRSDRLGNSGQGEPPSDAEQRGGNGRP